MIHKPIFARANFYIVATSLLWFQLLVTSSYAKNSSPPSKEISIQSQNKISSAKVQKMDTRFETSSLASLDKIKSDSMEKPQLVVFLRHFG